MCCKAERYVLTAICPSTCVGLWGLDNVDDPETAQILGEAAEHPDDFVLKPQREGGGNNLYGEALQAQLRRGEGLAAYILMQRIRPPINM
jgi:glutathione synthase